MWPPACRCMYVWSWLHQHIPWSAVRPSAKAVLITPTYTYDLPPLSTSLDLSPLPFFARLPRQIVYSHRSSMMNNAASLPDNWTSTTTFSSYTEQVREPNFRIGKLFWGVFTCLWVRGVPMNRVLVAGHILSNKTLQHSLDADFWSSLDYYENEVRWKRSSLSSR